MPVRLLAFALALMAAAPASAERRLVIERFEAALEVDTEGMVIVEETITARFIGAWNGIFRTIPVQYRTPQGLNYTLRLDVDSVTDAEGNGLRYESSRERHYRKLKIWVPGAANNVRSVQMRYRVHNALRFFEQHDELYWNVTGDEWEAPIESAAVVVRLPPGAAGVRATAFRGAYGSTDPADASTDGNVIRVETTDLGFREGLTLVAGWEPGIVRRPGAAERTAQVLYSNLPLAIPPLIFAGMLWLWRKRGRDPDLAPVITRYEPPDGMTPAELGTLIDGTPDMRDISATIVDLAVRGYLHIEETKTDGFLGFFSSQDYRFTLKKPREEWRHLKLHEAEMLRAMFGAGESVSLSGLKNKFYKHLPELKEDLYGMLVRRGFYTGRPDRVRVLYVVGGLVLGGIIGVAGSALLGALGMQPISAIVAGVLSALVIVIFGWFMPARTARGTRELEKVLGFQEFLSRVEGDRIDRMVKTPEMFEKFLPYAMALGVADSWAKAFEGIYQQPPQWYTGGRGIQTFHPAAFTSNLGRMATQAAAVMASAPRSSGGSGFSGGSSGGGFGGGGGGGF